MGVTLFFKSGKNVVEIAEHYKTSYSEEKSEYSQLQVISIFFYKDNTNKFLKYATKKGRNFYYIENNNGRIFATEVDGLVLELIGYKDIYQIMDKLCNSKYIYSKTLVDFLYKNKIDNILKDSNTSITFMTNKKELFMYVNKFAYYYRTNDNVLFCYEDNKCLANDLIPYSIFEENHSSYGTKWNRLKRIHSNLKADNKYGLLYRVNSDGTILKYGLPVSHSECIKNLEMTSTVDDVEFYSTYLLYETDIKKMLDYPHGISICVDPMTSISTYSNLFYIKGVGTHISTDYYLFDYAIITGKNLHKLNFNFDEKCKKDVETYIAKNILLGKERKHILLIFNRDLMLEKYEFVEEEDN